MLQTDLTLPALVQRNATHNPEAPFIVDADTGHTWTYAEVHHEAGRWASAFSSAGVGRGDTVLTMLPPCVESAAVWIALSGLRALEVPVNTGYRGAILRYVIEDSGAGVIVVHADHRDVVMEAVAAASSPPRVIVVGNGCTGGAVDRPTLAGPGPVDSQEFLRAGEEGDRPAPGSPTERDIAAIIYTSGTTGPSKGVLVTWRQIELTASAAIPADVVGPADSYYSPFPMFHVTGKAALVGVAMSGASVIIRRRFTTGEFWKDVRTYRPTSTLLLGVMANFLQHEPLSSEDADNPLRDVLMVPLIPRVDQFAARFGVRVRTMFNMTETACCILSDSADLVDSSSCGRLRPGFEARLVNDDDIEVATGELGELVLRADQPWSLSAGYWGKPGATVSAWRNLWFHTGDAFIRDDRGNFYFVDRIKDAIRRRGENISSAEVEVEVNRYPPVLESAAVAVPSEFGEDEVKVVVVPRPGQQVDPPELIKFLTPRMARFMLPRYVEVVNALPMTPTQKVRKAELRSQGITDRTWDRETHA